MSPTLHTDWRCPEADANGFVSLDSLGDRARELGLARFVERYPLPGLLVLYREPSSPEGAQYASPLDSGIQLLTVTIKSTSLLRYLNQVGFVTKRPGNRYAHLVSIGRSASNDIVVAVESLSKVHGYFVRGDDGWSYTDHGSTNGSRLNDRLLEPAVNHRLGDNDVLQLGPELAVEYLGPEALYARARQG